MQDNIYKITKDTLNSQEGINYLLPGIHEDCELVEIVYDKTNKGNEFIAFYVENDKGQRVSLTEWPTKLPRPVEAMSNDEKQLYFGERGIIPMQLSRFKQIIEVFKPIEEDTQIGNGSTFKDLAEGIIAYLKDSYKGVKIRVKVVFDNKGYTTLAAKYNRRFIEPMTVAKEDTKLIFFGDDKIERPKRDIEQNDGLPSDLSGNKSTDNGKDDLPF